MRKEYQITLESLLTQITEENLHEEVDTGSARYVPVTFKVTGTYQVR
jgi:hypothetical protein